MLRQCPSTCIDREQQQMNKDWLEEPERAKVKDGRTYYVETLSNADGLYAIDLSHFFGAPGQSMRWQVGVYVESPGDTRDEVLKIMNDIVTQAG